MPCIFFYTFLLHILPIFVQLNGQKFNGKVKSYAFDVNALPGGSSIALTPPKTDIKDNDPMAQYAKTDAVLSIPPIANQAMAMVEALHPKLDVKRKYAKWMPKAIEIKTKIKELKTLHVATPKLLPLRPGNNKIIAIQQPSMPKRNKPIKMHHTIRSPIHHRSLLLHRTGNILGEASADILKMHTNAREGSIPAKHTVSEREGDGRRFKLGSENSGGMFNRVMARRDVSEKDDFSRSIEALIAQSLRSRNGKSNITRAADHDVKSFPETKTHKSVLRRRKLIRKKVKELGSPDVKRYMQSVKSRVDHVVSEAKNVLEDTGKIVHGIKRVINGAKMLTDFTKNAVKFAKYFAMEPGNATVDFFEEKAVMAVLEAQKAAAEAKIAAVEAKEAAKRVKGLVQRFEKKKEGIGPKRSKKLIRYMEGQAKKAEKFAQMTSFKEKDARKDAVSVDEALRRMIELANRRKQTGSTETADENEAGGAENTLGESDGKGGNDKTESETSGGTKDEEEKDAGSNEIDSSIANKTRGRESGGIGKGGEEKQKGDAGLTSARVQQYKDREEEGSGNEHNKTKEIESQSKAPLEVNTSKSDRLEASELPDLFNGGGDENEVIANDFEKEGFSIPSKSSQDRNDYPEVANEFDKFAENRTTKKKKSRQPLNEESEAKKSESDSTAGGNKSESTKNSEKTAQNNADTETKNKFLEALHSVAFNSKSATKEAEENDEGGLKMAPAPGGPHFIERKVQKIDKGPVNLIVTVTRRKLGEENKSFNGSESRGKKEAIEDYSMEDPFNFKSLEARKNHRADKSNYIIDKEDAGRAGLSPLYKRSKSLSNELLASKRGSAFQSQSPVTYGYKPAETFTQI